MNTRWELLNGVALCVACHRKAHDKPLEFSGFVEETLGFKNYVKLREMSKKIADKFDLESKLKELITLKGR